MRHIDDAERRARLARRHGIAPAYRYEGPVDATSAMVAMHATEPASVHLGLHARVDHLSVDQVDQALYGDRSLVKQLAMRRTLFTFARDLVPFVLGSASSRIAGAESRRLAKDVEQAGVASDGATWIDAAIAQIRDVLDRGGDLDAAALREAIPDLNSRITFGSGTWAQEAPASGRVITVAGARGDIVRGDNGTHWRQSRPRWSPMERWMGAPIPDVDESAGYLELIRRWLWTFGPGTEADLVWWLGGTKTAVRAALTSLEAVEVTLDGGGHGFVLPDDVDPCESVTPWAALLPALDPTTMGWKERDFYLQPDDVPFLFDTAGNGGTTAWWDGEIVGCWVHEPDGSVRVVPRRDLPSDAVAALNHEAERLTSWLDGVVVNSVYASPQQRGERLP